MVSDQVLAYRPNPSSLLNSVFMSSLNTAAKSLVSVASNLNFESHSYRWRPRDHFKFMVMLMSWSTVWVIRVFMDYFPFSLPGFGGGSVVPRLLKASSEVYSLPAPSSAVAVLSTYSTPSSMDLILQDDFEGHSVHALGRVLTNVLALMNEIPATSRKYQFAMTMADKIMDGNFKDGHSDLMEVNRTALASAFGRTLTLLNRSLQKQQGSTNLVAGDWAAGIINSLPLGSHISSYVSNIKFCLRIALQTVKAATGQLEKQKVSDDVMPEKLAQELLWITNKLQSYGFMSEAMVQWSHASSLASMAFGASPRVQGFILKISAMILRDLAEEENMEIGVDVKFRLLVLWLPLFSHANNGVSYPFLTSFEKMEVERAMDEVIWTLPAVDQEIILTNWLQDFTISSSDWPNLQLSYDRWCSSTRQLAF